MAKLCLCEACRLQYALHQAAAGSCRCAIPACRLDWIPESGAGTCQLQAVSVTVAGALWSNVGSLTLGLISSTLRPLVVCSCGCCTVTSSTASATCAAHGSLVWTHRRQCTKFEACLAEAGDCGEAARKPPTCCQAEGGQLRKCTLTQNLLCSTNAPGMSATLQPHAASGSFILSTHRHIQQSCCECQMCHRAVRSMNNQMKRNCTAFPARHKPHTEPKGRCTPVPLKGCCFLMTSCLP